ncbi:MAG: hypothetical protein AAFX93_01620 [Verrucomicrobiota bacterium]
MLRTLPITLFACLLWSFSIASGQSPAQEIRSEQPATDHPDLPNVLFLGDEVMFAYMDDLQGLINGTINATFISMPQGQKPDWTSFFRDQVNHQKWDVIHFNYGREAMLHVDPDGEPVANPANGTPVVSKTEIWTVYDDLHKHLAKTDAFLVGSTTTPIRGRMPGYDRGVDWIYRSRFQQMLGPNGVKINDLADYTTTRLDEMVRENSYLPTTIGAQLMAEQVANSVLEALNEGSDPNRPRVLIVGDSIVGGYYGATRDLFAGEASVYAGGTTYNNPSPNWKRIVDEYIEKGGKRGWDVIQFNWGLHAIKYVDENNKNSDPSEPGARIQFTVDDYLENLEEFVDELERTDAELIFATTTPVPETAPGSIRYLDLSKYNDPATKLMASRGIKVNDLYSFAAPRLKEIQHPNNVHFSAYGSAELAKQNYRIINEAIAKNAE